MVHITHPTGFSPADERQPPACRRCPAFLKLFAKSLVMCPFLLYFAAGDKDRIPVTVITGSKKTDPAVDTDNRGYVIRIDLLPLPGDRDMEKELPVPVYQLGSTELPRCFKVVFHTGDMEARFDPSLQGIQRKHAVLEKRIVPVPYEVILIRMEYRSDPFLLVGQYGTVTGDNRTEYRLRHLRFQAKLITQFHIQGIVHNAVFQFMCVKDPFRYDITGSGICPDGIKQ